uniref:Uncharacterized protein n=1 Tax=Ditylenchus dipsaci TaxID=166011 RepID=A0A915ENA6_9BILA
MPDFPSCKKVSKQNMIVTMASAKLNWRIEKFKTLLKLTSVGHCFPAFPSVHLGNLVLSGSWSYTPMPILTKSPLHNNKRVWVENIEGKEISMRIHPNPSNSDYVAYLKKSQFYPQIPDDTFTISFEIDVAHEILTTVCDEPLQDLQYAKSLFSKKNTATTAALRLFAVDPAGQHVQLDEGIINKNVHSVVVSSETLLKAMHSDGSLTVECEVEYISKVETVEKIDQQIEKKTF